MISLLSHSSRRTLTCGLGHVHHARLTYNRVLYSPHIYSPSVRIARYSTPATTDPKQKVKIPTHIRLAEKIKEEFHRFVAGAKLLGHNTKNAASLLRGVANGKTLSRRERLLMVLTVSDLIRMVPFIVIVIVPFAEFALPVLLKLFPNMLPSTFTSASQKENVRNRQLQAKLKVIEVLQAASKDIAVRNKLDHKGVQESLVTFMAKVSSGQEVKPSEVLQISETFHDEFDLDCLNRAQLVSLVKFLGLPSLGTNFILQESVKFKWNRIRRDDAHISEDGIDTLTPAELEEAAVVRGYNPSNSHQDQKQYLQEWVDLSKENVPPYLLLLSRASYFAKKTQQTTDITPPVIAPYVPPLPEGSQTLAPASKDGLVLGAQIPDVHASNETLVDQAVAHDASPETVQPEPVDVPEKEIVTHLSHEFAQDPVAAKLWSKIARYTSDLKKETFGGREGEVIHLGDSSGEKLSTVITAELRQYLQALFVALDKDGDHRLSADEVEHGLHASDIPVKHDEVKELMQKFDYNGDKHLQFDEFVDCLLYLRGKNKE